MPTNAEILLAAPSAGYLAANAVDKGKLFGKGRLTPILPNQIYALYFIIKKIYDYDPDYPGMTIACLYLWEIMGRYGVAAGGSSGGGSVAPITPTISIFPFYITSSDFEVDGLSYNNPDIVGVNLELFIDEYSQQFYTAGVLTFSMTATGFIINLPGFSAASNTYTIRIGKLGTG